MGALDIGAETRSARTSVQAEAGKCGRDARTPRLPSMAFTALQQFGHLAMATPVVDTGCTQTIADKQWLHDWAAQLEALLGLKPTVKAEPECFICLGVVFDSPCMWTFTVGLHQIHSTMSS